MSSALVQEDDRPALVSLDGPVLGHPAVDPERFVDHLESVRGRQAIRLPRPYPRPNDGVIRAEEDSRERQIREDVGDEEFPSRTKEAREIESLVVHVVGPGGYVKVVEGVVSAFRFLAVGRLREALEGQEDLHLVSMEADFLREKADPLGLGEAERKESLASEEKLLVLANRTAGGGEDRDDAHGHSTEAHALVRVVGEEPVEDLVGAGRNLLERLASSVWQHLPPEKVDRDLSFLAAEDEERMAEDEPGGLFPELREPVRVDHASRRETCDCVEDVRRERPRAVEDDSGKRGPQCLVKRPEDVVALPYPDLPDAPVGRQEVAEGEVHPLAGIKIRSERKRMFER
ncbi:MAG: hypothetical protein KJ062_17915 [Thermoanaerobaculia bacterium]|nr:hypothetical protein [Thermoanaerobaculia bacterium]